MAQAPIPDEQGSLERLGIPNETEIPEGVLTPAAIRQVRFRQQQTRGYYIKDVEAFVNEQAVISTEWYVQRLHARDNDVHRLGEELDRAEVDLFNTRAQLELAAASAPLAEAIRDARQDPEVEAIINKAREGEEELARANRRIEALEADLAAAAQVGTAAAQDVAAQTRIAELEEELGQAAPLVEQVGELERYAEEQDAYIDALLARIDELEATVGEEQVPAASEEVDPTPEATGAAEVEIYEPESPVAEPEYVEYEVPEEAEPAGGADENADYEVDQAYEPERSQVTKRHVVNGVELELPEGLSREDFE